MQGKIQVRIEGLVPVMFHSVQLANPLNPWVKQIKAITSKGAKKKTDDDLAELMRLEWYGGLYLDEKQRPVVPCEWLEMNIRAGARATRQGKDSVVGLSCDAANYPLEFDGPKTADELWQSGKYVDTRAVVVQRARIMRTRPIFGTPWAVNFTLLVDGPDKEQVRKWLEEGGAKSGIGDFRPKFGRFEITRFS